MVSFLIFSAIFGIRGDNYELKEMWKSGFELNIERDVEEQF